jgi:hypothetical protein
MDVLTRSWDGTEKENAPVPTGVYFIRARTGEDISVRKVLLIR